MPYTDEEIKKYVADAFAEAMNNRIDSAIEAAKKTLQEDVVISKDEFISLVEGLKVQASSIKIIDK